LIRRFLTAVTAAVVAVVVVLARPAFAVPPTIVTADSLEGWSVVTNAMVNPPYDDSNLNPDSTASWEFVDGPEEPPLGVGSLQMSVGDVGNSRVAAVPPGLSADPPEALVLDDITALSYWTYVSQAAQSGLVHAPALKIEVFQMPGFEFHTLVFEPFNQTPSTELEVWQSWDTLEGVWWSTKIPAGPCSQDNECTWSDLLGIIGGDAVIAQAYFELGDSGTSMLGSVGSIDAVNINGVLYDLDTTRPAVTVALPVVAQGGVQTVTGTGFVPCEIVDLTIEGTDIALSAEFDYTGPVVFEVPIPTTLEPGQYTVTLVGQSSERTASATFQVVAVLPMTGSQGVPTMALWGGVLTAAGLALVWIAGRRHYVARHRRQR
jgi:hypothetical protein